MNSNTSDKGTKESRKEQLARWKREKEELNKQKSALTQSKKPIFKVIRIIVSIRSYILKGFYVIHILWL